MGFKKIGILGGGQLGRMLQEVAQRWNMPVYCMDSSDDAPAAIYKNNYVKGDIRNYDDVMAFGADKDVITIEIEHVNLYALRDLEKQGKEVHPNPKALEIIKNKNKQKRFYEELGIPIPRFMAFEDLREGLEVFPNWPYDLPCIYKCAEMGYDGKGVRTIYSIDNVHDLENIDGAFEEKVNIDIEVAVMIAARPQGEIVIYPPVAMYFDDDNHILSEVHVPYDLEKEQVDEMNDIAKRVTKELGIIGLCAFEFFITKEGKILLNEIAPRPHNSMHISMDNAICSQFEQHLRAVSDLPLGSAEMPLQGIMYNLIGENDDKGETDWQGWNDVLGLDNTFVHLYGKTTIKPARKMGHINIVGNDMTDLQNKLSIVKTHFKNKKHG